MKAGPAASAAVLGAAVCLLALAPVGSRLGWWHYGFSLYRLFPASGVLAVVAVVLSLATLARRWSTLSPAALAMLGLSLVAGAGLVYAPLHYAYARRHLPPINDISTDTADRPAFRAALAARAAESVDRTDTPEPRLSELQRDGYPDLVTMRTALPMHRAFGEALAVAVSMPGWDLVAVDADAGRIEAVQRSRWFGFTDDMVIRVTGGAGGSRIDMRSASRKGSRDYGVNARRIRAYMAALRARIG
jgi:uncharacterized protein (DUF1499 family)